MANPAPSILDNSTISLSQEGENNENSPISGQDIQQFLLNMVFTMKREFHMHEHEIDYVMGNLMSKAFLNFLPLFPIDSCKTFAEGLRQNSTDNIASHFRPFKSAFLRNKAISEMTDVKYETVGSFFYVPIIPQIRELMEGNETFRNQFFKSNICQVRNDGILQSPLDGSKVQDIIQKNVDDTVEYVIPIVLFFDEFCDVNPLGCYVSRNKLAIFEWRPVSYQGSSDCFILAFSTSNSLGKVKTSALNTVIVELSLETQSPFTLNIEGNPKCKVVLIFVNSDNLSAHQLCGLLESFGAHKFCLHCEVDKEVAHLFTTDRAKMRNAETVRHQQRLIADEKDEKLKENLKSKFGLNGNLSALIDSPTLGQDFPHCCLPGLYY